MSSDDSGEESDLEWEQSSELFRRASPSDSLCSDSDSFIASAPAPASTTALVPTVGEATAAPAANSSARNDESSDKGFGHFEPASASDHMPEFVSVERAMGAVLAEATTAEVQKDARQPVKQLRELRRELKKAINVAGRKRRDDQRSLDEYKRKMRLIASATNDSKVLMHVPRTLIASGRYTLAEAEAGAKRIPDGVGVKFDLDGLDVMQSGVNALVNTFRAEGTLPSIGQMLSAKKATNRMRPTFPQYLVFNADADDFRKAINNSDATSAFDFVLDANVPIKLTASLVKTAVGAGADGSDTSAGAQAMSLQDAFVGASLQPPELSFSVSLHYANRVGSDGTPRHVDSTEFRNREDMMNPIWYKASSTPERLVMDRAGKVEASISFAITSKLYAPRRDVDFKLKLTCDTPGYEALECFSPPFFVFVRVKDSVEKRAAKAAKEAKK